MSPPRTYGSRSRQGEPSQSGGGKSRVSIWALVPSRSGMRSTAMLQAADADRQVARQDAVGPLRLGTVGGREQREVPALDVARQGVDLGDHQRVVRPAQRRDLRALGIEALVQAAFQDVALLRDEDRGWAGLVHADGHQRVRRRGARGVTEGREGRSVSGPGAVAAPSASISVRHERADLLPAGIRDVPEGPGHPGDRRSPAPPSSTDLAALAPRACRPRRHRRHRACRHAAPDPRPRPHERT